MSFSISRFLGFSDDEIIASFRELQNISIVDENLNLEIRNQQMNEVVSAR